jgi:hypothetical protein|tara:strand:- start:332 stop:1621 length:1290 start_codon:yes stop_codon:yes gene_type:complete
MLLVSASLLFAGCILDPQKIDDGGVVTIDGGGSDASAMSGAQVESFLNDESNMNITALAELEDMIAVELYSKDLEEGELLEMTFTIGKDDIAQLSNTGLAIQSGMMGLEYRVIQGDSTDVNILVGNQWFLARDLVPEYTDPFVELASEDESGDSDIDDGLADLTPDFDAFNLDLSGMIWTVTVDVPSTQQVATSSNDTHSIMVEFLEFPPRLHQLEVNSYDGNQAMKLSIVWGDEVALSVQNNYPKTSVDIQLEQKYIEVEFTCENNNTVPWSYVNDNWDDCGDNSDEGVNESEIPDPIFKFFGEVNSDHEHEVLVGDIELRIGSEDSETEEFNYSLSMNIGDGSANLTDAEGSWWAIEWQDYDDDGFVSAGDEYIVLTNSSSASDLEVRFYDGWSQSYEGGPLPGFEVFLLLGALVLAALRRNTIFPR